MKSLVIIQGSAIDVGHILFAAYVRFVSWLSPSMYCLPIRFALVFVITTGACYGAFHAGSRSRFLQWSLFCVAGLLALGIPLEGFFTMVSRERFAEAKAVLFTMAFLAALGLPRLTALFLTPCVGDQIALTLRFYLGMAALWLITAAANLYRTWFAGRFT